MNQDTTSVIGAGARDEEPAAPPLPFDVVADNIVVEFRQREEQTASGLAIVREKPTRTPDAVVVGAGPEASVYAASALGPYSLQIEPGTTLIVRKHEAVRLELGDDTDDDGIREYHVFKPAAVLGIVRTHGSA